MRTETEELIFKMLEAKGGINTQDKKPKSKAEQYKEELKEMDLKFTKSLILKASKKI
tara:strand:- start:818 stop:988 length:171 start_codon:yes stop_codon:yes gene_type:complete